MFLLAKSPSIPSFSPFLSSSVETADPCQLSLLMTDPYSLLMVQKVDEFEAVPLGSLAERLEAAKARAMQEERERYAVSVSSDHGMKPECRAGSLV